MMLTIHLVRLLRMTLWLTHQKKRRRLSDFHTIQSQLIEALNPRIWVKASEIFAYP